MNNIKKFYSQHRVLIDAFLCIMCAIIFIIMTVVLVTVILDMKDCDHEKNKISAHTCKIIKIEHDCAECIYFIHVKLENNITDSTHLVSINIGSNIILTNHTYECWRFINSKWYKFTFVDPFNKNCDYDSTKIILKLTGISVIMMICLVSILAITHKHVFKINNEENVSDTSSLIK
jgi:hypothetical protein